MESQTRNAGVTLAALVGSVAVAMVNPTAGMAALQATLGVSMQSAINYTRENEFEADRLAIELLYNAGFAPDSMANFFQTLTAQYRFASKPPDILLTHPLPENRISEAKARALRYPKRVISPNLDFLLAKTRLLVRYSQGATANQFKTWDRAGGTYQAAALYGRALQALQRNDAKGAQALLIPLQQQYEDNLFLVDALTDAALLDKDYASALARLTPLHQNLPFNPVVVLNLAQTYQEQGNTQAVIGVLEPYVRRVKDDVLAWHMLTQAHRAKGDQVRAYMSQAEEQALRADYPGAIAQLNQAKARVKDNYTAMLINARIEELRQANIALENTL
jgi:predicted Zn-dependent protease